MSAKRSLMKTWIPSILAAVGMLAILIIGLLVVAVIVVTQSRATAKFERDELRIELESRKYAEEAGKPYNPDKPCGHSLCEYPLCWLLPAGSPATRHPQDQGCYLNDGVNYYEDDDEEAGPP